MQNDLAAERHLSERTGGGDLTRQEFADLARVHRDTVKRWARQGIGPKPRKLGPRLVRYDRTEVQAFLNGGHHRRTA